MLIPSSVENAHGELAGCDWVGLRFVAAGVRWDKKYIFNGHHDIMHSMVHSRKDCTWVCRRLAGGGAGCF